MTSRSADYVPGIVPSEAGDCRERSNCGPVITVLLSTEASAKAAPPPALRSTLRHAWVAASPPPPQAEPSSAPGTPVTFLGPAGDLDSNNGGSAADSARVQRRQTVSTDSVVSAYALKKHLCANDAAFGIEEVSRDVESVVAQNFCTAQQDRQSADQHRGSRGSKAAAIAMVKASSGQRLKRAGSYQRRLDPEAVRGAFAATTAGHDGAVDVAPGGFGDDGVDSLASTALTDDFGRRRRKRGVLERIPLWLRVCALMLVPIVFVTAYLGVTFHAALSDLDYIRGNAEALRDIFLCGDALQRERDHTSAMVVNKDSSKADYFEGHFHDGRASTDAICGKLRRTVMDSRYEAVQVEYQAVLLAALTELTRQRFIVDTDALPLDLPAFREAMRTLVRNIINGIAIVARASVVMSQLTSIKDMQLAANRFGMCRAITFEILSNGTVADENNRDELVVHCSEAFRRTWRDFRQVAEGEALRQYNRWQNDSNAQGVLKVVQQLVRAPVGATLRLDPDTFYSNATAALNLMLDMSQRSLDEIVAAEKQSAAAFAEGAKLLVTLAVSLVGVAFVSRAQRLGSAKVEFALERTKKTALAVQAFIPKNFLRLMSVTSVLHLERGDQTLVAVTLLFCDIRNFTGISETMSNESLFEWLQTHLKRMTEATEKNLGFVSMFVGDAVQSIFGTPVDAVKCAIDMQATTDSLCYELVAKNEDHMVVIGCGLHNAIVGVGILGNDKHYSCAIVSAEVNVAAQLEALTKEYGARIIATAAVFDQLAPGAFEARPLGRVRLAPDAVREYTVHEIFQADMPETKEYKEAITADWEALLTAQEYGQAAEAAALLDKLEAVAKARKVRDGALAVKRANLGDCVDKFALS